MEKHFLISMTTAPVFIPRLSMKPRTHRQYLHKCADLSKGGGDRERDSEKDLLVPLAVWVQPRGLGAHRKQLC